LASDDRPLSALAVDAAVVKHLWASHVIANQETSTSVKRNAVRTAILLAPAREALALESGFRLMLRDYLLGAIRSAA